MKRRSWEVNRRALLRGTGTAISLPFLEAMLPGVKRASAAGAAPPRRLVFFTFGTGVPDHPWCPERGAFWPSATGPDYPMTRILQPLQDLGVKSDALVIHGLSNDIGHVILPDGKNSKLGDHDSAQVSLLTGVKPDNDRVVDISVDQVAANAIGQYTPSLPSLFMNAIHTADQWPWGEYLSFTGVGKPRKPFNKSSDAFVEIFGDTGADTQSGQKRRFYKQSVLHYALEDAKSLEAKLGKADRQKLDEYLSSIASLEARIKAAPQPTAGTCAPGTRPEDTGSESGDALKGRTQQMLDMLLLALQCDRTRVVVQMMGIGGVHVDLPWLWGDLGKFDYHNDVSHCGSQAMEHPEVSLATRLEAYKRSTSWFIQQFAYLVKNLKVMQEPDGGSVLDNTRLVCCSELGYGDGHPMTEIPVIVAGGGITGKGRFIRVGDQPVTNLWLTMLSFVGVDRTSFGDSTGALSLT